MKLYVCVCVWDIKNETVTKDDQRDDVVQCQYIFTDSIIDAFSA